MDRAKNPPLESLHVKLLGPLTLSLGGRSITPPASRKARALLAYLLMTPRATARNRLCELLLESVGDSRAELRWYLSKLRGTVGATRIHCDEDTVRIDPANSFVDALEVQRMARKGVEALALDQARRLFESFQGDFLEGLELDGCPVFSAWQLAQRRRFRVWRVALLQRLAASDPQGESLGLVEKWLELAPFDTRAHEQLLRGLVRRGRHREAREHLDASIRLFRAEEIDSAPLTHAWRAAGGMRPQTTATEPSSRDSEHAYDYFLQGRQHLSRMMQRGLVASRQTFVRALELDPRYGPAWAGLATVHTCLAEWFDSGAAAIAQAEHASRRALESAPQLAEAHVARGLALSLSKRHDESIGEFETAIRLNPYLFEAYYYFARTAFSSGDMARAATLFREAAQLRQEDFQSPMLLGTALRTLKRDDEASEAVRTGIRRAAQILALNPDDGRALSLGAGALIDDGQIERGLSWSSRALELYPDDTSALVNCACVHARLDQRSAALDLLERAFARGAGKRDWVENDPDYTNLRGEARFNRLLARLR